MTLWYIARGAGLAALLLLSISTALGALMTGRHAKLTDRVVWNYVHRVTASLGLAVLAIHLITILADPFARVGWKGALVPFTAAFRPTWVGLGTVAVYTFLLVAAVGFARGKFAATARAAAVWRQLHSLAYVGWAMAMWHGFMSGTDSHVPWVRALYVACAAGVVGALGARLTHVGRPGLVRHTAPTGTSPISHLTPTTTQPITQPTTANAMAGAR